MSAPYGPRKVTRGAPPPCPPPRPKRSRARTAWVIVLLVVLLVTVVGAFGLGWWTYDNLATERPPDNLVWKLPQEEHEDETLGAGASRR